MVGVIFALGSALFLALAQVALRKSYKEFKPSVGFFFDALFGLLLWVPLAVAMGVSIGADFEQAILFAILSAILSEALYFYALSHGELAVTAAVLATYPVYTVIFSRLINHEILSGTMLIFVILAIVGGVLATVPDKVSKSELRFRGETIWPFVSAVGIGLSDTLSKGYINRSDDFSFLFALGLIQFPVALVYLRLERESIVRAVSGTLKNLRAYKQALLGGLFNIIGTGFLWLSFSYAPASIVSPITGINGALTVVLARYIFAEKLSIRKYVGIAFAFVGVIGIAVLKN